MKRRNFIALLTSSLATHACSNNVSIRTMGNIIESSLGGGSSFDPNYPETLPYASIAISRKGMDRALLVLGKIEQEEFHWISSDRGVLVTRHGRVVRTVGFPENLLRTDFADSDCFNSRTLPDIANNANYRRIIDLSPGNRYGIKIEASFRFEGNETIRIGHRQLQTNRIVEDCIAPETGWKFTNNYWLDTQGTIWRSQQTITPGSIPFTIEVTKPYGKPAAPTA